MFEQRHIGISSDEFRRGLHDNLERLPDLVARATDAIVSHKKIKLPDTTLAPIIKNFRESLNLTEETGEKVVSLMNEKYGRTNWGLINGMTEVAQQYTLERRIEIEKYAGNLLMVA